MKSRVFVKVIGAVLLAVILMTGVPVRAEEMTPIQVNIERYMTTRRTFSWESDSVENVYKVMRSTKKDKGYEEIAQVTGQTGTVSYEDIKLSLGRTFYYRIDQVKDGEVVNSSEVMEIIIRLIPAQNVQISIDSDNDVTLKWDKVSYASGYYISRSTSKSSGYKRIATVKSSKLKYTDDTPTGGKTYYYKVRAYRKNNSKANTELKESTAVMCHTRPASPKVKGYYTTSSKAKLSWTSVTGATHYNVFRKGSDGKYVQIGTTENKYYYDEDVDAKKLYEYKVSAQYEVDGQTLIGKKSKLCSVYTSKIDPDKKMVALTFDDGPGPYTKAIVNCLKENDARATFFVIGNRISGYKKTMKLAYENGNEIANHTYSHPTLTYLSVSKIKSQINKTDDLIEDAIGKEASLVRAPGGATNKTVRNNVSKPFIYWSIDTRDWATRSKKKTIDAVMNNVKDGDIILMHDIHYPTKEAALEIIPKLKKKGYQLVTVSEMAAAKGYNLKNGTTYYSLK